MDTTTLIIIIVVLFLLFGGGGGYYWSRHGEQLRVSAMLPNKRMARMVRSEFLMLP